MAVTILVTAVILHMVLGKSVVPGFVDVRGESLDLADCALCGVVPDVGMVLMGRVREMVMDNLYGMTTRTESRPTWPSGLETGLLEGGPARPVMWTL